MAKHPRILSLYQEDDSWFLMVEKRNTTGATYIKHYQYLNRDQIESVLRLIREHYIVDPHTGIKDDTITISAFRKVVKI